MHEITFREGKYSEYLICDKDPDTLYFLDNGKLFKGSILVTDIYLVEELPEVSDACKDSLYIVKSSGGASYFDGTRYYDLASQLVGEIRDDTQEYDNNGATIGAIKSYVSNHKQINEYDSFYEFPAVGEDGKFYLDRTESKLYVYSDDSGSYVPIKFDLPDIDLIDVNFN